MLLRELIDIPREIHRGRFVLKLTEGVARPAETVGAYVVTEQLAQAFGRALSLIGEAVQGGQSRAAYLHGSFGSGKSHFMAVLHLLLQGESAALSIPRLQPVLGGHPWLGQRRFLVVPFHMVGAKSLEQALFQGYVEHIGRLHPKAPPPAVYRSEALFENARRLRATLGDEVFFAELGGGGGDDLDWGGMAADRWDGPRFEAALAAPPLHPERTALLQALVRSHFPAFESYALGEAGALVDIDRGLAELTRHAQSLGYDALVLFLDEVILWLAGHASDADFVSREGQKLAKLVEGQVAQRALPLVAFLARQKPLKELVGEELDGIERARLDASMTWNDGRFAEITLEDRNLPVIAHERLLKPKDAAAAAVLAENFERALRVRRDVVDALTTQEGDKELFRLVYPFSPALVQALVALSAALQRERSALRIMLQILVDQRDRLEVGKVVPLGDLWDALMEGTEAVSAEMAARFEAARRLWRDKLLPVLRELHGITGDAVLGPAAHNEGRWMKTLLLAALVPEVGALRHLTAARLAALNHGTVTTPIPGQEAATVEAAINRWVARGVTEIRRSGPLNAQLVSIELAAVPVQQLLDAVQAADTPSARRRVVRKRVLEHHLGLKPGDELLQSYERVWRGTRRRVDLIFQNVRTLEDDALAVQGDTWRILVDFPFDEPEHGPAEDVQRVERFLHRHGQSRSMAVAWLPRFFSEEVQAGLGLLARLENLLENGGFDLHAGYLPPARRAEAREHLGHQRNALLARLDRALSAAYGLEVATEAELLADWQGHGQIFMSLDARLKLRPPATSRLRGALDDLIDQALGFQFPGHPVFALGGEREDPVALTPRMLGTVWQWCERALDDKNLRTIVEERRDRSVVKAVVEALQLGDVGDGPLVLHRSWPDELNRKRLQAGKETPTVRDLRGWLDPEVHRTGLPTEVLDLLVLVYAGLTHRTLTLHGAPVGARLPGQLREDMALPTLGLPEGAVWEQARARAAQILGVKSAGEALSARNVEALAALVRGGLEKLRPAAEVGRLLRARAGDLGVDLLDAPRLARADALAALATLERHETPRALLEGLARWQSALADAVLAQEGARLEGAREALLKDDAFRLFGALGSGPEAAEILAELATALRAPEAELKLKSEVDGCHRRALILVQRQLRKPDPVPDPPVPDPPVPDPVPPRGRVVAQGSGGAEALEAAREALASAGAGAVLVWRVEHP